MLACRISKGVEVPAHRSAPKPKTRVRVLWIDDEALLLRAMKRAMKRWPCEVLTATDQAEAMAVLASTDVDAIVCDMVMPGGSGIDVHEAVTREHPGLEQRMVFVTGGGQDEEQRRFLRTVPNPVFHKPPELQAVFEAICEHLERCSVPPTELCSATCAGVSRRATRTGATPAVDAISPCLGRHKTSC